MENERAKKLADEFCLMCNENRRELDCVVSECMRDHRTNQQTMMTFVVEFINQMAEQRFDARNEASVALARKLKAAMGADQFLPYI